MNLLKFNQYQQFLPLSMVGLVVPLPLPLPLVTEPLPPAPLVAQASPATRPQSDTLVIPGVRVGPITRTTTRQELNRIYGAASLRDAAIPGGEGETEPGTIVNLGPRRSFTIIWSDNRRQRPIAVVDLGRDWRTPEGIGVGTTFAELQQKLGNFQLYGFEWDYGGTIELEGTRLERYQGALILRVEPSEAAVERSPQAFEAVLGDELYPSSNPNLRALDIQVSEMLVYLGD